MVLPYTWGMNRLYRLYMDLLMERGYLTLEEFVDMVPSMGDGFTAEEVEEFFDIMHSNIVEGIYTKAMEIGASSVEEMVAMEYERLQKLKDLLMKKLGIE